MHGVHLLKSNSDVEQLKLSLLLVLLSLVNIAILPILTANQID